MSSLEVVKFEDLSGSVEAWQCRKQALRHRHPPHSVFVRRVLPSLHAGADTDPDSIDIVGDLRVDDHGIIPRRLPSLLSRSACNTTVLHNHELADTHFFDGLDSWPAVAANFDSRFSHFQHPGSLRRHGQGSSQNISLLQTLCRQGELGRAVDLLDSTHTDLPSSVYILLLRKCSDMNSVALVKRIHAHIRCYSEKILAHLGGHLVVAFIKCGSIEEACYASSCLPKRTVFTWTAIISAYVDNAKPDEALMVYDLMQKDGVQPNNYTFSSVIKACGSISDLKLGRRLHSKAREKGFSTDTFVGCTLVSMYSKCGSIAEAEDVFMLMVEQDTVVWNAMLEAYMEHGQDDKAIQLYRQMQEEQVSVDNYTLTFVFQACGNLATRSSWGNHLANKTIILEIGWGIWASAKMTNGSLNDHVQTAFLTLLGKCGVMREVEHIMSGMPTLNTVLCTAILSVYTECGHAEAALQLFGHLQAQDFSSDPQIFVVALKACALLAERGTKNSQRLTPIALEIGQALHAGAYEEGYVSHIVVGTALITMYGKCSDLQAVEIVFSTLPECDDVCRTALLTAFVENGEGPKAVQIYEEVGKHAILDEISLICNLQAIISGGSLEMCRRLHFDMVSAGYDHLGHLAATLICAYASCAGLTDAQAVFDSLSVPDSVSWNACISGHKGEESLKMYERMQLADLQPSESTFASVLSACTHTGLVSKGIEYFDCFSRNHGLALNLIHCGSLVDLLGRAGDFERAIMVLQRMPMQADINFWQSLLSACLTHGNTDFALDAFDFLLNI